MSQTELNGFLSQPTVCKHKECNKCVIASTLAQTEVYPTEQECTYCSNLTPPQTQNMLTLALAKRYTTNIELANSILTDMKILARQKAESQHNFGPGTELKKLISWFYSPDKKKCKCLTRIAKMNKWGPDICLKKIHTIIRWLKHSARIHKIPFFEPAARLLVLKAIKKSQLQLQRLPGKTALLPIVLHPSNPVDGNQ